MINKGECIDDLQIKGLRLIQKNDGFKFGVDAVLLSDFAKNAPPGRVMDLCSGTGVIPLLLWAKTNASDISGLEIQSDMADMAKRSIALNGVGDRVHIFQGDLKNASEMFGRCVFDVVTCNPPYIETGSAITNDTDAVTAARHEILCSLDDVIRSASELLKPLGRFYMIHRPGRLADILCCMRKYRLEPKTLRFVHPSPKKPPKMLLVEGRKNSGRDLKIMAPLFVHDENGCYSEEIEAIYGRDVQKTAGKERL